MPKKLEAKEAQPFQPIKAAFLKDVLDDGALSEKVAETPISEEPKDNPETESVVKEERRKARPALVEPEPTPAPKRGRAPLVSGEERLNRPLKVQLQATERLEIGRIVNELSSALGTPLSVSHVTRALLTVFRHAETELHRRARQHGPLKRPPNDDLTAIAVFEQELAKLVLGALREAKPLRE